MGKSAGKTQINEYRMSIHYVFASGPVDEITGLYLDKKPMWEGVADESQVITLNKRKLFGGPKKEGGPVGEAFLMFGEDDQEMPANLATKMGETTETCPAYRGLTSIFFTGSETATETPGGSIVLRAVWNSLKVGAGFLWGNNNPFLKPVSARMFRAPKGLNPALATISKTVGGKTIRAANPAHIIYECYTHPDLMGGNPLDYDTAAFEAAAQTLYDEGFGLAMTWARQSDIDDIVAEVLDHIQATVYEDLRTGLTTIKLLRDDYIVGGLPELNPDNAVIEDFQRRALGETINEIVASWTNPDNEEASSVTVQDLANIASQDGQVVSDSRDYHGVRWASLAGELAQRDLRAATAPLATCTATVDHSLWDKVYPGAVLRMPWAIDGIDITLIMRVTKVDIGRPGASGIKLSLLEDVWSLARSDYGAPTTQWVDPSTAPDPVVDYQLFTLPALMAGQVEILNGAEYPEVGAGVLSAPPSHDSQVVELYSWGTSSAGTAGWVDLDWKSLAARIELSAGLSAEASTDLYEYPAPSTALTPTDNSYVFIGAGGDEDIEIGLIEGRTVDGNGWIVRRGVLDTVPREWPTGTPVWFVSADARIADDLTVRAAGETLRYKLLDKTSVGTYELSSASEINFMLTDRPYRPLRPANVAVNGTAFGSVNVSAATDIAVTWATRNRLLETTQILDWTADSVVPEYRQRTIVILRNAADNAVILQWQGLWAENGLTFPKSYLERYSQVWVEVSAERDGFASLQSHRILLTGLPNNGTGATPPTLPAAGEPPPPSAAPGVGAFSATGSYVAGASGTRVPVIVISGTPDDETATDVVIETRATGGTWARQTVAIPEYGGVRVEVRGVAPLTLHNSRIAYLTTLGLGAFRDLADVTTGDLISGDTAAVGGVPAADVLTDISDLFIVYGDTTSAAASAAAAAASAAAASASAATADGSASDATTQAANALISAGNASTQASNALTQATAAAASAGSAGSSATTAATQAANASASASSAATQAANASASASSAVTQATNASNSATAASTSATTATAQANAAALSASGASTSATTATAQANAAALSASGANTAATNASNSATAAATSATNAATQATNAATSATNAGNSATAASGSATTATNQANSATGSATAASASATAAQSSLNVIIPQRPSRKEDFYTAFNTTYATPEAIPLMTTGTVVTGVANEGSVLEIAGTNQLLATRGWLPVSTGKTFTTDSRLALTVDGASGTSLWVSGFFAYSANGTYLGVVNWAARDATMTVAEGWRTFTATTTSAAILAAWPTAAYIRAGGQTSAATGCTFQVSVISLRDTTDAAAAAGSATAAATSASSAATSATAAGSSASSASTSATNAATSATNAANSASSASTSATSASGSASTATTQAANAATSASAAATSATNAANSATAASTSASTAATSATNAGNSATAAATSAVNAASSFTAANNVAVALLPETIDATASFFGYGVTGASGANSAVTAGHIQAYNGGYRVTKPDSDLLLYARGLLPAVAGRVYEVEADYQMSVGSAGSIGAIVYGLDTTFASVGSNFSTAVGLTSGQSATASLRFSNVASSGILAWPAGSVWLRFGARTNGIGVGESSSISRVRIRDVTSQVAAETSASAAATSASSASTSATNAGTSASSAATQATNAATSATNAANSASAAGTSATSASGSASTATTQAANAATSASAAATSATNAANSASAASTSASNASTSATNAGNSATSAATQATNAASSFANANLIASALFPDRYDGTGQYFSYAVAGTPASMPDLASNATASGYGPVRAVSLSAPSNYSDFATRGVLAAIPGRVYKIEIEFQRTSVSGTPDAATSVSLQMRPLDSTHASPGFDGGSPGSTFTGGVQTLSYMFSNTASSGVAAWRAGTIWVRPFARINSGAATALTVEVRRMTVTDVTEQVAAATSATAAATSASNAATSATAAGSSATSASNSATSAATSATNAANSASAASTSATSASGSASTATTQAANAATSASAAATSATNASNSATAASGSASSAATQATNAGNSATSAAASATSASSSYTNTVLVGGNQDFSDGVTGWNVSVGTSVQASYGSRSNVFTNTTSGGKGDAYTNKKFPFDPSRKYKIRAWYYTGAGTGPSQVYIGFRAYDSAGAALTHNPGSYAYIAASGTNQAANAGWVEYVSPVIVPQVTGVSYGYPPGTASIGLLCLGNYNASTTVWGLDNISLIDVTEAEAAATSATAAATSASNAATSATAAGTSATAASTSATNAATSATNASNSASAASTSATSASNSASTATTQAANASTSAGAAATSATNAANSATAASGSASTASTQATNAGNSAASAATSATNASSSFTNTVISGGNNGLEDGLTGWGNAWSVPDTALVNGTLTGSFNGRGSVFVPVVGAYTSPRALKKYPFISGRKYRVRASFWAGGTGSCYVYVGVRCLQGDGTVAGANNGHRYLSGAAPMTVTSSSGWVDFTSAVLSDSDFNAGTTHFQLFALLNQNVVSTMQVALDGIWVDDVTEEVAAASSATAAATSATNAATSATAAGSSATSASGSATSAATQATNAANSASSASTSATNASNSASTATTQAANASTSAGAAATSATSASNSATAAAGSASTASTQATNAGNSATSAAASSVSAASSYSGARSAASAVFPSDFSQDGLFWSNGSSVLNPPDASATYVTVSGVGRVAQSVGSSYWLLAPRGLLPATTGRTYEFTVKVRRTVDVTNGGTSEARLVLAGIDATYAEVSWPAATAQGGFAIADTPFLVADGWVILKGRFTVPASPTYTFIRPRIQCDYHATTPGNGQTQVAYFIIEDVTSQAGAEGSATAAATSASAAATSATNAGTSASAANTSATNAATSASAASTSATNASNSATSAAGSAATSTTQATNAATSATNAANSASAASTSATNAATQATNAGNSATAAASSATNAASSYSNTVISGGNMLFDDGTTGWAYTAALAATGTTVPSSMWTFQPSYNAKTNVLTTTVNGATNLYSIKKYTVDPARKYKVKSRFHIGAGSGANVRMYFGLEQFDASGATVGSNQGYRYVGVGGLTYAPGTGWVEVTGGVVTGTGTGTFQFESNCAYVRLIAFANYDGNTTTVVGIDEISLLDVTEAEAAAASATAAATSASNAATSATAAGSSATSASGSATSAATQATNAANSASSASTSATNASNSASTATTQAANASTSAGAAATSATSAANSATAASGSASTASTQATNAGNSATAAAASATSASSSYDAARLTVAADMPSDFLRDGDFWFNGYTGDPTTRTKLAAAGVFSYQTVSGVGRVLQVAATGSHDIGAIGAMGVAVTGRRYRATISVRITNVPSGSPTASVWLIGMDSSYNYIAGASVSSSTATLTQNTWVTQTVEINSATIIAAGGVWLRPMARMQTTGNTYQVKLISLEDITESYNAATSATAASTSATAAASSATNAGTSASTASTQASNASTSAGNAASSATTAGTQATNAATSASGAASSATAASGSATTASTQAGNASTSATAATNSATAASASAAAASSSATIAASVGVRALVKNPNFNDFPTTPGIPTSWINGASGSGAQVTGETSLYAYQLTGGAGTEAYIYQDGIAGGIVQNAWFVIEAQVKLDSGAFTGAGVLFRALTSGGATAQDQKITFSADKDSTGAVVGAGTVGKTYRFAKLVQITASTADKVRVFAMNHWTGHGSVAAANQITWYSALVRPATDQEIATQQATTDLAAQSVSITTQSTAIATLQQVYGTYGFQVNANGNIAGVYLYAAGGITSVSGVKIEANQFLIRSGTASAVTPFTYDAVAGKLSLNGVVANEIEATATIKIGAGDNTVIFDGKSTSDKRIAVGNSIADSAPFWVSKTGKMKATDWELYDANGALMLSKNGPTEAFKLSILAAASNSLPTTSVLIGSMVNLPSTTTVTAANKLVARLGDDSSVSIGVSWNLNNAYGANAAAFPSTVTLAVHQRYSTDGVTWGAWSSVGSQVFTKITSGSPTSAQFRVKETTTTYSEYDSEAHTNTTYSETFAVVDAGSPAAFTITAAAKSAGYYEYCVVGGDASPFLGCASTMTLTDTDGVPSFIINTTASTGSVSYSNPIGSFKRLRIESTGNYTATVTAAFVIVSTPEGLTRTIANLNTSFDLSAAAGIPGRLASGTIAANTWYYVWAISNGSVDGVVVSTSATDPALTGYRYKALIGVVRTAATAIIRPFKQRGAHFDYTFVSGTGLDMASGLVGSINAPTWVAVGMTPWAPIGLVTEVTASFQANNGVIMIAPNNTYGDYTSATNKSPIVFQTGGSNVSLEFNMAPESNNIYWATSHASAKLVARGFILDI